MAATFCSFSANQASISLYLGNFDLFYTTDGKSLLFGLCLFK